jgi:Protein of unknown function (DUF2752)
MRFAWRRLPTAGPDHELIWLLVSVGVLAGGAAWLAMGLAWPHCPFLAMTGLPCLTCGATRATIALFHGDFRSAFSWNPLAFLALCGVAVFDLYAILVLVVRAPRLRIVDWTRMEKNVVRIAIVCAILLNWMYLLANRGRF